MADRNQNQAAWLEAAHANPLTVGPGPDQTTVEADEVIIRVSHVAINPSEWKMQDHAYFPLPYPTVLGSDVAGEIVEIGSGVTKFKPGDRVIGHCLGLVHGGGKHGGFQSFTTCRAIVVAHIPDTLSFSEAVVLPLALSTSMTALFEILELSLPTLDAKPKDETVLIWGGSSSCGSTAIQLAVAAGYTVATTASSRNHDYVKSLGATHVFDHSDPNVVDNISKVLGSRFVGVFDSISEEGTQKASAEILRQRGGGKLAIVLFPLVNVEGVEVLFVNASNPGMTNQKLGQAVWGEYVPAALAAGKLLARPEAHVLKGGLAKIQEAMNLQKQGVSAKKIVVEL